MKYCEYSDIFGIPKKGFHSYRIFGIAAGDLLGTIAIAWLIAYTWSISFWKTLIVALILGEVLHYLFCVRTAFLDFLGL